MGTRLYARTRAVNGSEKKFVDLHYFVDEFLGPDREKVVALRNGAACDAQDTHRVAFADQDDSRADRVRENASAGLPKGSKFPVLCLFS